MNNLNNIPGEIIKTSQLPDDVPSHLIGVILGTSPKTVKYPTTLLAKQVSTLLTDVVKTTEFYSNPSWITDLDWSKLTNVPSFSTSLSSLSDVSLGILSSGQLLQYNGNQWVNWTPNYLTGITGSQVITALGYTPANSATTLTINGVTYDLTVNRTWSVGNMLTSVYDTDNSGIVDKAEALTTLGRNSTGNILYKGTVVRIQGSTGNRPNFVKAQGNNDANSAQTFGIVMADMPNNTDGYVIVQGTIDDLDTRPNATHPFTDVTLADGDLLYLHPTIPGYLTNIKPYAPHHLVYVGVVTRTSPTNGTIVYRIQNGYELDEIHDVAPLPYINNGVLYRDTATSLWKSATINTLLGFTPENVANKGANNGYAELDSTGKVPPTQLPSYVDDVIEVANYAVLPLTGETGKIYITLDTNFVYRWSGSVYVKISQPNAVWGSITGTLGNQTDLQNALALKQDTLVSGTNIKTLKNQSLLGSGNIDLTKSDIGLNNVDNTSDANKPISTAQQTALDAKTNKLITTNRQTSSYTLVLSDADKLVEMNVGSANNLTIPLNSSVAFAIGTQILLAQYGAGQTTIVPTSGVTIRSNGGKLKLNVQYSGATLIKIATDEWYLFGDIAS